jgi:catechol 2,3-dioxygenase-like lactoylglutathione lyase family enzyme
MPLLDGCNHIALVTNDVDRLIRFYTEVFDAEILDDMTEGDLRHVLLDLGGGLVLHPFQLGQHNPSGTGSAEMFQRGHIDHFGMNVADVDTFELLRTRLVEAGVSDGTVHDFGVTRNVWFSDPDGMGCEIVIWGNAPMRSLEDRIEEPYLQPAAR